MKSVFVNISFVGSDALAKALGDMGAGVVVTQVVPFPGDTAVPIVAKYHAALKAANPSATPGFVSLEGYLVGRLAVQALSTVSGDPTRQGLLDAVSKLGTVDMGGIKLEYGAANNKGSDEVFLTVIQPDGSLKPVETLKGLNTADTKSGGNDKG